MGVTGADVAGDTLVFIDDYPAAIVVDYKFCVILITADEPLGTIRLDNELTITPLMHFRGNFLHSVNGAITVDIH